MTASTCDQLLDHAEHEVHNACPVCQRRGVEDFFHLERLPIHVGMVYASTAEARRALMGQVTLSHCAGCGFVFNRAFQPEKLVFAPGYEVQLVHSPVFMAFLKQQAARLIARYDLHGKDLIDLGCGAGHFLRMLCEAGGNRGIGIDPTLVNDGPVALPRGQMRLIRSLFGEAESSSWQCDFATCQSVLEDVADPVGFLTAVRRTLFARRGHAYLEVFNAFRAFAAGEVWSLTYEQCNYYSLPSFSATIRRAGFHIVDSGTCYGDGQYLFVEATPDDGTAAPDPLISVPSRHAAIDQFAQVQAQKVNQWRLRIEDFRRRDIKAAVWGSGGKGICFLNTVSAEDVFPWVVDINPDRQGRHVPGSGQQIVSPSQLQDLRPQVVVITNPLYESEIRGTVSELNLRCDFLTI